MKIKLKVRSTMDEFATPELGTPVNGFTAAHNDSMKKTPAQKALDLWKWTYDAKTVPTANAGWICNLLSGHGGRGDTEWEACFRAATARKIETPSLNVDKWPEVYHFGTSVDYTRLEVTLELKVRRDGTDRGVEHKIRMTMTDVEYGHAPKDTWHGCWIDISEYPLLAHKLGIGK